MCANNFLTNLKGSPLKIQGSFCCHSNQLEKLDGSPTQVFGEFWCDHNRLSSLNDSPSFVGGNFICYWNNLKTLSGLPKQIGGYLDARDNPFISLGNIESKIGGKFRFGETSESPEETLFNLIFPSAQIVEDSFEVAFEVSSHSFNQTVASINEKALLTRQLAILGEKNPTQEPTVKQGQSKPKFKL